MGELLDPKIKITADAEYSDKERRRIRREMWQMIHQEGLEKSILVAPVDVVITDLTKSRTIPSCRVMLSDEQQSPCLALCEFRELSPVASGFGSHRFHTPLFNPASNKPPNTARQVVAASRRVMRAVLMRRSIFETRDSDMRHLPHLFETVEPVTALLSLIGHNQPKVG